MLIQFSVGNYKSFKRAVTLSMVASAIKSKPNLKSVDENNLIPVNGKLRLLKSAVIYGANASGKSNLITAISFMRRLVLGSAKNTQSSEKIAVDRFRLGVETDNAPSFFEIIFLMEGKKFRYGFEVSTDRVSSEWFYFVPTSTEAKLFERDSNGISIGKYFKEGRGIEKRTRDNALFLSVAAQLNGEISGQALDWFRCMKINLGINFDFDRFEAAETFEQMKERGSLIEFIGNLDLDIEDIVAERIPLKIPVAEEMPEHFATFLKAFDGEKVVQISTVHRRYDKDGNVVSRVFFDMVKNESHGTIRLFALAPVLLDALREGDVVCIDELGARLHPILTRHIIGLFNNKITNPKNAQLVFTTHETDLLTNRIFRRDQIWFTEKDRMQATDLYSLAEFKVRNDRSFEKDYIHGRYGAIPFIKDRERLVRIETS
jgi:uncharacterized protein